MNYTISLQDALNALATISAMQQADHSQSRYDVIEQLLSIIKRKTSEVDAPIVHAKITQQDIDFDPLKERLIATVIASRLHVPMGAV